MKYSATIPQKLAPGIFDLPCVLSVRKETYIGLSYSLDGVTGAVYGEPCEYAYPGDTLICDDGKWKLFRKVGRIMIDTILEEHWSLKSIDFHGDLSMDEIDTVAHALSDYFMGGIEEVTVKDVAEFHLAMRHGLSYVDFN